MKTVPIEIIELDGEEGEQTSTSYHHTESPSTSQLCEVSSSSPVPAKSKYVSKSQKGMSSTSTFSSNTPTGMVAASCKKNSKKPKVLEKTPINTTAPVRILPKPHQHEKLNEKIITCKPADIIDTRKESLSDEKSQKSIQKFLFLSPISQDPNNPISKILLFEPDLPVENSTAFKPVEQTASKLVCSKPSNQQQRQWEDILPVESNSKKIIVPRGRAPKKMIREQRVYLTESRELMNKDNERKNAETKDEDSIGENIRVTDEEDPLYIPILQRKIPSSLSIMKAWKGPFAHRNKAKSEIDLKTSKNPSHSNTPKPLPTQMNTNIKDIAILTPIVTLTEPTNSEHSIVRNYTLLNKVTTKKNNSSVRSKSVPPRKRKKDSKRVADSDLIYRKKLVPGCCPGPVVISDRCRNFFIKNSAWDYLEPVFKGFNEREYKISHRCSDYFSRLSKYLREYVHKQTQDILLTDDDLYYTRKIELLDKEGKLDKVYYVPPQVQKKRKKNPTYTLPPTKKCKIVLERDEYVEDMLKTYLLREKLDSNLCHTLSIPKKDANKPLIILNKFNFNVLKLNETLCQHTNIIYVKNVEDGFPQKLYKNDYIISKIENKTIRLVSPEALRHYFM